MDFSREYLGQWIDDRAAHGQIGELASCSISGEPATIISMTLDYPFVTDFSYIHLRGEFMPTVLVDPDSDFLLRFVLFVDEYPEHEIRSLVRFGREQLLYRRVEHWPVSFGPIEFPTHNISARNSLRIKASVDDCHALLGGVRLEVGYTIPERAWDGYNISSDILPDMRMTTPNPFMDSYGYSYGVDLARERDFMAQRVYIGLGNHPAIPDQYIRGVPREPALPVKHKGFYVEEENQDRKDCLYCGEPLKRIDFYMICEECDG